MHRVINTRTAW